MGFTGVLTDEHKLILRMIRVLEEACDRLVSGEAVPREIFYDGIDFIRNFADRFHHAKEEDILFSQLIENGMPEKGSPIEAMLFEHDLGRSYVRSALDALEKIEEGKSLADQIAVNLRGYAALLKDHINKEDSILYPLSERVLPPWRQERCAAEFVKAGEAKGGEATASRYRQLVEKYPLPLSVPRRSPSARRRS
jgi:hemerythrin-like domain-containing protein